MRRAEAIMASAFFTGVFPTRKILTLARGQCYKAAHTARMCGGSEFRHAFNREGP
jgi:hypothetical protein